MKTSLTYKTSDDAVSIIKPGDRVYVQGSAQTPTQLLKAVAKQAERLKDVEFVFITVYGDIHIDKPEFADRFKINSLFVSASVRSAVNEGRADYVPVFLSEIPDLFNQHILPIDVALVQVSPPDKHGYCSLGVSVDVARSAVNTAKHVIASVNPNVPRTHGDGLISVSEFDSIVFCEDSLYEARYSERVGAVELKIAEYVSGLIDDGSTLQMGIGAIPDAVLRSLANHKNLGMHTEMCSDGVIDLYEKGVINNRCKQIHPNKGVSAFALGTKRLYDFLDDNPAVHFLDIDYVNDPHIIRRNNKMVAINRPGLC
jgi:acyl-CoA hydrolase